MSSTSNDQEVYNFDEVINRVGTSCMKYDALPILYPDYAAKENVFCCWVADMDFNVCPSVVQEIQSYITRNQHSLDFSKQYDLFVQNYISWCFDHHNYKILRDQIHLSQNTLQTVTTLIRIKSKKGQGIIVMNPIYYMIPVQIKSNGRKCVMSNLLQINGEFHINFEEIEKQLADENNKILFFCNPHNPSGRVWTKEEVARLSSLCLRYNVYLISDDIYADLTFSNEKYTMAASLSEEINQNTATLLTISKSFNVSGLAISSVIIPNEEVSNQFKQKQQADGFYCANLFGIIALGQCFGKQGENWLNQLNNYVQSNFNFMVQKFKQELPQIKVMPMQAGFLTILDFTDIGLETSKIKAILLEKKILFSHLKPFFEPHEDTLLFRINIACPKQKLLMLLNELISGFSPADSN